MSAVEGVCRGLQRAVNRRSSAGKETEVSFLVSFSVPVVRVSDVVLLKEEITDADSQSTHSIVGWIFVTSYH